MTKRVIVLDAMGVMYRAQDDVAELLVPFVRGRLSDLAMDVPLEGRHSAFPSERPGAPTAHLPKQAAPIGAREGRMPSLQRPDCPAQNPSVADDVAALYLEASLGQIDADAFWRTLGLEPSIEDDYLSQHRLTEGLLNFLALARASDIDVWCLSNDVSRWSRKLRERFALNDLFAGFVISGDIGHRKPSEKAYRCLLDRIGTAPDLFVDDQPRNVTAAQNLGIPSVCFGPALAHANGVSNFVELSKLLRTAPQT